MKKIIIFLNLFILSTYIFSQEGDPAKYLANNNDFINWVSSVTNNEWDVYLDFKKQLGDQLDEFKNELIIASQYDNGVNGVISKYNLDPEFSDQKIAEHITYGLYLKQENPWLWQLADNERLEHMKTAYFYGMSSDNPRWQAIKQTLLSKVFAHCGTQTKIIDDIIACFWDTIKSAAAIVTGFQLLTNAINSGNWSATISAVKKILKSAGRNLGWFGAAIAAIDIALCIWDALN